MGMFPERVLTLAQTMAEELVKLRDNKKAFEQEAQSSRVSLDSNQRLGSPAALVRAHSSSKVNGSNGAPAGNVDYAYLKNVLLQFLEQKDKKYQVQLIPVLGMLLHFDK